MQYQKKNGGFTCYELKISISDLHSKAAQTYVGHDNYLVCPFEMANKILKKKDEWLEKYPNVGIKAWDGHSGFRVVRRCRSNYYLPHNDKDTLMKGVLARISAEYKAYRDRIRRCKSDKHRRN